MVAYISRLWLATEVGYNYRPPYGSTTKVWFSLCLSTGGVGWVGYLSHNALQNLPMMWSHTPSPHPITPLPCTPLAPPRPIPPTHPIPPSPHTPHTHTPHTPLPHTLPCPPHTPPCPVPPPPLSNFFWVQFFFVQIFFCPIFYLSKFFFPSKFFLSKFFSPIFSFYFNFFCVCVFGHDQAGGAGSTPLAVTQEDCLVTL